MKIYTGVLFQALGLPELPGPARRRVLIFSGLWGVVRPGDRIPGYKLRSATKVPGPRPARRPLARSAPRRVARPRAGRRHALGPLRDDVDAAPGEGRERPRIHPGGQVISHMVKATRGRVARVLLAAPAPPRTPEQALELVIAAGMRRQTYGWFARRDRGIALLLDGGRLKAPGRLRAEHRAAAPHRHARGAGARWSTARCSSPTSPASRSSLSASPNARPPGRRGARRRARRCVRRAARRGLPQRRQPAEVRRRRAAAALRRRRPRRARRAARPFGMRRRLRELGALETSARQGHAAHVAGHAQRRASTCSSSGRSHRELLVSGPAATAVVADGEAGRRRRDRRSARDRRRGCPRSGSAPRAATAGCSPPRPKGRRAAARPSCRRAPPTRRRRAVPLDARCARTSPAGQPPARAPHRHDRVPALRGHRRADRRARALEAAAERARRARRATSRPRRRARSASCSPTSTRTAAS